jgi:hypothetical protein
MELHNQNYDDTSSFIEVDSHNPSLSMHQKQIRQRLEERLELKRLKKELEYFEGELDGEFDWEHLGG